MMNGNSNNVDTKRINTTIGRCFAKILKLKLKPASTKLNMSTGIKHIANTFC